MASPVNHSIITGGLIPSLSIEFEPRIHTSIVLHDNYSKIFKKYGIDRFEMMAIMGSVMRVDVLSGLEKCDYYNINDFHFKGSKTVEPTTTTVSKSKNKVDDSVNFIEKFDDGSNPFNIVSVELSEVSPDSSGFNDEQLKVIDIEGLTRQFLTITFKEMTDELYFVLNEIVKLQYELPMVYLKPVREECRYVCQKSHSLNPETDDLEDASITIEPSHPDFFNVVIPHTPINQSLPIGTIVKLFAEIPYNIEEDEFKITKKGIFLPDGTEMISAKVRHTGRRFISSHNLQFDSTSIGDNNKLPVVTTNKYCVDWCHYGAIEIGSRIIGKFVVSPLEIPLQQSFTQFGFRRSEANKTFTLWTYNGYNITPMMVLNKIKNYSEATTISESLKKFIMTLETKIKLN
jgi:hypothetical protein